MGQAGLCTNWTQRDSEGPDVQTFLQISGSHLGGGSPPWQCLQTSSMIMAVGGATGLISMISLWVEARKLLRVGQCTGRPTEDQGLDVTGAAGGKFLPKAQNS